MGSIDPSVLLRDQLDTSSLFKLPDPNAKPDETLGQIENRLNSGYAFAGDTITYSTTGTTRIDADGKPVDLGLNSADEANITSVDSDGAGLCGPRVRLVGRLDRANSGFDQ